MKKLLEKSYSSILKKIFRLTNPIKKQVVKTECKVHKFINGQALTILKNDGNTSAYNYLYSHLREINAGAVWADQDYKSINHFYNPEKEKGMYGFSNAHLECVKYYTLALTKYFEGEEKAALFYLGAACHLIQDMTVPQHVNIKLLKHHRRYEQWVIKAFEHNNEFRAHDGGIYLKSVKDYIEHNTEIALNTFYKYEEEKKLNDKFYKTTLIILVTAQKTTAGLLMNFYNDVINLKIRSSEAVKKHNITFMHRT